MGRPTPERVKAQLKPWVVGRENSDGEARGYCPICEDPGDSSSPSASFNFGEGLFTCFSKCGGMSITTLVNMLRQSGEVGAKEQKAKEKVTPIEKAPSALGKLPSEDRLEEFVDRLMANSVALQNIRDKRGYTKKTIEEFQIGWDGQRYTIPVRDRQGELVNVRRYKL